MEHAPAHESDLDPADPSEWVHYSYDDTLLRLHDGSLRLGSVTTTLVSELAQLDAEGSRDVDLALAHRACMLLGMTIAHAVAEGVGDGSRDQLLEETLDDLKATVSALGAVANRGATGPPTIVAQMLGRLAALAPADVAEGEQYGDLFMVAATAWDYANSAAT